jgi:hypothetical protein
MVRDLDSKEAENLLGGAVGQSKLVVVPTPLQDHRSNHLLSKDPGRIKRHLVPHYEIGCSGQRRMSNHGIGLG